MVKAMVPNRELPNWKKSFMENYDILLRMMDFKKKRLWKIALLELNWTLTNETMTTKLWQYSKNYSIIPKRLELWFTIETKIGKIQNDFLLSNHVIPIF